MSPTDDNPPSLLREADLLDQEQAAAMILNLAGNGVSDEDIARFTPLLLASVKSSPDPDRALLSFSRWFSAVGNPYSHLQLIQSYPGSLELFCIVAGSSYYFADLIIRRPEYFDIIADPGPRGGIRSSARLYRDLSDLLRSCRRIELKKDVLRTWKAREMLRVGVRDISKLADMPATAREFSNLADACVQAALDIALLSHPVFSATNPNTPVMPATVPFAVVAMGKLGGQELNYSSDIDLMFVHGDSLPADLVTDAGRRIAGADYLDRVARTLIKVLADETSAGHVFRVDMRLRPEGRFGALIRSLSGFQSYYESWAESWERQALLKARFIAGDRLLGDRFHEMTEPFVYRRLTPRSFLSDIRENKRRIELKCELEGESLTNIKTGIGGIRDIEFTVQSMQLEYGASSPHLRTPNTLSAIQRLHHAGLLAQADVSELSEDYRFLRTLEHRLQLLHGFQTQALPDSENTLQRYRLARRMGFQDLNTFEQELNLRRTRTHDALQRLFYHTPVTERSVRRPTAPSEHWSGIGELLSVIDHPAARERLSEFLIRAGFRDVNAAIHALQLPMQGDQYGGMPPDTPREFAALAPKLLTSLENSADADAGLAGMELIALAVPNRAQLYASLNDSPQMLDRLTRLAAASPPLLKILARHQEWLESILAPDDNDEPDNGEQGGSEIYSTGSPRFDVEPAPNAADAVQNPIYIEMMERIRRVSGPGMQLEAISRVYQREILHLGAHDVWKLRDLNGVTAHLGAIAAATLQALLVVCFERTIAGASDTDLAQEAVRSVAIVGLGKLGGAELSYASDWDIVFVYDDSKVKPGSRGRSETFAIVNGLVEQFIRLASELPARGADIEIDLRLRPWGRAGSLIHSIRGFIEYYRTAGETWERQAALKAAYVAGNAKVGNRFVKVLHAVSYGKGISSEENASIKAMKARIESERLRPWEHKTDIKLGHGGLSDVEWLVQRLQLINGRDRITTRTGNTLRALSALASARLIDNAEADALAHGYRLLSVLRNALWIRTGADSSIIPSDPHDLHTISRILGYERTSPSEAARGLMTDEPAVDGPTKELTSDLSDLIQHSMEDTRSIFLRRFLERP